MMLKLRRGQRGMAWGRGRARWNRHPLSFHCAVRTDSGDRRRHVMLVRDAVSLPDIETARPALDDKNDKDKRSTVANIKSQIKRIKTNNKAHERNKAVKSSLRTASRRVREALAAGDIDRAEGSPATPAASSTRL